ncbi:MAG TPA: HAD-IA family hydrolase [Candidatus Bathyarchaeia archaeon]|nr:HAD-IA family hydrolase [Candidatus Bathyarchaeia archaeon]
MKDKTYQYLLLDWDGCLADTLSIWMAAYKNIFKVFGLIPAEKEIVGIFGDWQGASKLGVKDNDLFFKKLLVEVNANLPFAKLHQGVKKTLVELTKRSKKLALVTSSKSASVLPALKNLKVQKIFQAILTEERVTHHKPHPEIVDKAIAALGGNKDQALIIGDGQKDILAGQNAGIDTLIFYPQINSRFYSLDSLKKLKPDYFIRDFKAVLEIIN